MRNASIAFDGMTASALALVSDQVRNGRPVVGYAFDSIGRYGKGGLLRDRFIPRILSASSKELLDGDSLPDPQAFVRIAMRNEKQGGHGERPGAIGLIEAAAWDLRGKLMGQALWEMLAADEGEESDRGAARSISVYGSCGHFRPGRGEAELSGLAEEVRQARSQGFDLVKIKLGGVSVADDEARVESAMAAAQGGKIAVDVNGGLSQDIEGPWLRAMNRLGVAFIEEPAPALDFQRLSKIAEQCDSPLATGENLFSFDDARNLLRYGGLRADQDLIQIDVSLSYGIGEYRRILDAFERAGWSRSAFVPHAGHLFAAQVVGGLRLGMHEAATDPSAMFSGLWSGTELTAGRAALPHHVGTGFEHHPALFYVLRDLAVQ